MRLDKSLGTIEVGKIADVIVLEGNPLKRIENLEHVRFVMKWGPPEAGDRGVAAITARNDFAQE